MNALSLENQARCALMLSGKDRQDLLVLCRQAAAVVRALPAEEVYQTIKEVGGNDALPLMAVMSTEQLQYAFDVEWWRGDKFLPDRALNWLEWAEKANDEHLTAWFQSEEFEAKVVLLQALLKVGKEDETSAPVEGVGDQAPWTPDGVYKLYFMVPEAEPILKRVFMKMVADDPKLFFVLMEGVIWELVTPAVERAYQWRLVRTGEKGIPDFQEAFGVYSMLAPNALKLPPPEASDFVPVPGDLVVPPRYPLAEADPATFFGQCLALLKSPERFDAICWELVYLANKVLVADRRDMGDLEARRETLRKVLGYINLGLESGAGGDIARGEKLLAQTWMQNLFQVGYGALMRLKWDAEKAIRDHSKLMDRILSPALFEHLMALVGRFPKIGMLSTPEEGDAPETHWRDVASEADLKRLSQLLEETLFQVRFVKMGLGLAAEDLDRLYQKCRYPQRSDIDATALVLTSLANHALFGQVVCEPISEAGALSFLQMIFLPTPFPDEPRVVTPNILEPFKARLLESPMAWTDPDRDRFENLIQAALATLDEQFGRLDPRGPIEWKFTRGLCIQ
ncbi:MAG: DUF6178 family protein [Nitrospinaceae bacterium]